MDSKWGKWAGRIAAVVTVAAFLFSGPVGLAEEMPPVIGQDAAVADVEIYAQGDVDRPYEGDTVQLICLTPGAEIYYTTDGQEPTEGSTRCDAPEGMIRIGDIPEAHDDTGFTIRARAFLNGEASANITEQAYGQVVCEPVVLAQASGIYPAGTQIGLSCNTPGAQIYYYIGEDIDRRPYTGPIPLSADMAIRAYAEAPGYQDSEESSAAYIVGSADIYEPNDVFDEATPLEIPADIRATISNRNDQDYFAFSMPGQRRVRITLAQPDTGEDGDAPCYDLKLFDAEHREIDVAPGESAREILRYLAPGDYYALVCGDGEHYSASEYGLSIETLPMDAYDFSEYNLVNAAFHPDSRFHFKSRNLLDAGSVYTSVACLSRWDGYLTEEQDPYVLYYDDYDSVDRNLSYYHTGEAAYRLRDVVMLPTRADALDNESYKNAIYTYGALYCGIQEHPDYYSDNKTYFYHPQEIDEGSGHAVTVVGWDDNIPKEKFQVTFEGQDYMPACDGAFLAKNSYGPLTGEDGFFYISYDSAYFSNNAASAMIAQPARSDVNVLYMHDPYGYTGFMDKREPVAGREIWAKNVFTASSDQVLKSVSFYALGTDQAYDIYVDTGGGDVLASSGVNRYAGYYTVDIEKGFPLKKGEAFSVTVKQANMDGAEITAALERASDNYAPNAEAKPGQSFLSFDGAAWQDISDELAASNCVKAYACDPAASGDTVVTEDTGNGNGSGEQADPPEGEGGAQGFAQRKAATAAMEGGRGTQAENLPSAFDLRDIGAVTSVKNQGNPPTCWTFATMGSTESCLLKAGAGFDTGVSVSLDAAQRDVFLDGDTNGSATATVFSQNNGSDEVYWQFAGDLGSIEIQNRKSASGEKVALFAAKEEGSVRATAVSVADGTKSATIVFDIKASENKPATPTPTATAVSTAAPTAAPAPGEVSPRTGDARDVWPFAALLAAAGGTLALFAVRRTRRPGTGKK